MLISLVTRWGGNYPQQQPQMGYGYQNNGGNYPQQQMQQPQYNQDDEFNVGVDDQDFADNLVD